MESPQTRDASSAGSRSSGLTPPSSPIAPDCRYYDGRRPCQQNRLCSNCTAYAPYVGRICVIKLGALGDVIRTLCILPEVRRRWPEAQVTWVSSPAGERLIRGHPQVDRALGFSSISALVLAQEHFDTVICLDKEAEPCALAMALQADRRLGVGLSVHGTPVPLDRHAEYYMHLGLCDELKFEHNRKSYPQLVYEALGWTYRGERYELQVTAHAVEGIRQHLVARQWDPDRPTLGVNVGAGTRFANKMWPAERVVEFICHIRATRPSLQVVLLGGLNERGTVDRILAGLTRAGVVGDVIDGGTDHDERHFVALIDACEVVFSGDTMAMHAAIALGTPAVGLFAPTCEQEIDVFGRGRKLVAAVPCSPCYRQVCDNGNVCVEGVSIAEAAEAVGRFLDQKPDQAYRIPASPGRKAG